MSVTNLYYIQIAINFLAALTALLYYRKKNKILLPVVIVLICIFISTVVGFFTARYIRNNQIVNHFINPVMLACWGYFFHQALEDPRVKRITAWAAVILIICSVINSFITGILVAPWVIIRASTIFYLILGALLLIQMLDLPSKENVFKNTFFLIALGIVWFNMISSLSFFLSDVVKANKLARQFMYTLLSYSNYIYYSILLLAMYFQKKLNKDV